MTLLEALTTAIERLGGVSARSDAEILLRHAVGLSRTALYSRIDQCINTDTTSEYFNSIERLKKGEPLQYITGHMEFFGLDFSVSQSVLIPRPETEILVEKSIELAKTYQHPAIADVGCGSGAVAVALAKHLPEACITALDISDEALKLARTNATVHSCNNIVFHKSDLLEGVSADHFDVICANLPYVPTAESQTNHFEPQLALDGGINGLDIIRRLVRQIAGRNNKPDWLLMEFGTGQAMAVKATIEEYLPLSHTEILYDLIPVERVSVTRL
ncbi:protein-N(5)-glutamine methyltransferase PrmC [Dehalogenimonas sp. WBC-2]|nr:protein-N(5)-glutamine methyltransferase PrmC [Dehalogenimonas sp. WBC-2]